MYRFPQDRSVNDWLFLILFLYDENANLVTQGSAELNASHGPLLW